MNDDADDASTSAGCYCTRPVTGTGMAWQPIYVCRDIAGEGKDGGELFCICQACADACHDFQDVEYMGMGPSNCDCAELFGNCRLQLVSQQKAEELGVTANPNHAQVLPPATNEKAEVFRIPKLCQEEVCSRLIKQCQTLVSHTHETHWVDETMDTKESNNNNNNDDASLCDLEALALDIYRHHMEQSELDKTKGCGAEWWVQVKELYPFDSTESRLVTAGNPKEAVDLHFDKDEALAQVFGLGSFPALSTVTYLTEGGSPTLVFPHRYNQPEDNQMENAFVSHPRLGKHLVFDGRLLHGAPSHPSLRQVNSEAADATPAGKTPSLRVTFLVNIWLEGSRPCRLQRLDPVVREEINSVGQQRQQNGTDDLSFERLEVPTISLDSEDDLPEEIRGRVELPFVSKGATWVTDTEEEPNLVLVTFPPPPHKSDTVRVSFGSEMQAYLDYNQEEDEAEEEEEQQSEEEQAQ